jgi:hypothetical protein
MLNKRVAVTCTMEPELSNLTKTFNVTLFLMRRLVG